jgi:threonine/homoserine/homoserine lactone efflux protein
MALDIYLAYIVACLLVTIIPGPTVTVIIANSLTHGTRAGLLNVAGTQVGLALMMGTLIVGLTSVIEAMGWLFDWLRIAGALYLAWLGWKLIRSPDVLDTRGASAPAPRGGFFLQGVLVLLANPKALLFFGAFIPQFIDPSRGNHVTQIVVLSLTAMAAALLTDGAYALLIGRAGAFLSRRRVRLVSRVSGGFLIGGGIWLALTRAR